MLFIPPPTSRRTLTSCTVQQDTTTMTEPTPTSDAPITRNPASLPSCSDDLIAKIEYFTVEPRWVFVRVESTNGHVGWGEGTLEG